MVLAMGVLMNKLRKSGKREQKNIKSNLRSSIVSVVPHKDAEKVTSSQAVPCEAEANGHTASRSSDKDMNMKSPSKRKSNRFWKKNSSGGHLVTKNNSKWNFEDEYKSYLQKSMKRKLRSSNVFETNELHKDQQRWSALFHESIAHEIPTDKLKIASTNLKTFPTNFKAANSGIVVLKKLPTLISKKQQFTRGIQIVLDKTTVNKYLTAKKIIDEILKPHHQQTRT